MELFARIDAAFLRFSEGLGRVVSFATAAIICFLLWELAARFFFRAPTNWAHEASTLTFGAAYLLAGVLAQSRRAHIRIDVIYLLFPRRARALADLATGALIVLVLVLFLQSAYDFALQSWLRGEVSSRTPWQPPIYPVKAAIPATLALLIVGELLHMGRCLLVLLGLRINAEPADD